MEEGERTLTTAQVERLAALLKGRIDAFCDAEVRAPSPEAFRAARHWMPHNCYDLSVEIDIGTTVLTLRSSNAFGPSRFGPGTDLDELSREMLMHVLLARSDAAGIAELRTMEASCRARIKRDGSSLDLISVRFAPGDIHRPGRLTDRAFWVTVGLLDDVLLPYEELLEGHTVRAICSQLKTRGGEAAARRAAFERLREIGAVLEIEDVAEHAIVAAGRSVGEVAKVVVAMRRPGNGCGRYITLQGARQGRHVSVVARDGCIRLESDLAELRWTGNGHLTVHRVLPETVTLAFAGGPLGRLVEHPLFKADAIIEEAVCHSAYSTDMRVATVLRPIGLEEMDGALGLSDLAAESC